MKKSSLLLLTLLLAVLCVGCGGGDKADPQPDTGEQRFESAEGQLLYEKMMEIGAEGLADMTREELIAALGEPHELKDYMDSVVLSYEMLVEGDELRFTAEYSDLKWEEGVGHTITSNVQGAYPKYVQPVSGTPLLCPIEEPLEELLSGALTMDDYFDHLRDWGVVSHGKVLENDPLPQHVALAGNEDAFYVYTPEYRYECTLGSVCRVTSLKHNPLWDGEALRFLLPEAELKRQFSQGFDILELLGKTPEEASDAAPFLFISGGENQGERIELKVGSCYMELWLNELRIREIIMSDYDEAQERVIPALSLHGLPLSASLQELDEHMKSQGYQCGQDNNCFYYELGYTRINVYVNEDGQIGTITFEDYSGISGYEPVEDATTQAAKRSAALLEDYFLKNLAVYGYGSILADLTHDGLDELLVTTPDDWGGNTLSVYTVQDDQVVELYSRSFNMQANANVGELYLYSEDGKDYLMEVSVQISYMSANSYTLYSLDENGQPVIFRKESTSDGLDDAVVQEHKTACIEKATLLISHTERYTGNAYGMDLKPVDLMEVICYPERAAKKTLGDFYNTDVSVKINSPDPFAQSGSGLPDNMLNDVFWIRTSSPLVSIGGAMVGMTEADFLAALEPLRNPAFRQTLPTLSHPFLEGTYYAPVVDYTLKDGVVTEVTMYVSLADPA